MAISATFRADFAQFQTAVAAAETKLRSFQSGAVSVEKALTRMGDSFSGRRILSEATLAVKAVTDIGGATKLTEAEQKRLNATLTEALAKYKALGQQAPRDMVELEKATRGADQSMGGLSLSLVGVGKNILTTAAGFLTAQAAFAAVKFAVTGLVSELKTITLHGAAVADVAENFDHLTASSGRLGSTLLGELRAGTHGTITDFDLMKTATQDLAAGLNLTDQQFGTLAQGAFALAQATGGDVATALDTMNDAMLTGRTRSLALLTGKIDLEKAEMKFAASIGATRDQLSEEGKLEAARVAILESVGGAIARLGVQTDGLDEKVAQARANWANFENELGRTVATSPVIMAGLDAISDALTEAFGSEKGAMVRTIANLIDDAAIALVNFGKIAVTSAGFIVREYYAVTKLYGNLRQIIDGVTVATLYLGKASMTIPNAVGIGTAAYKANDDAIQNLMVTMVARGKALQDADQAQAAVASTSAGYVKTLDQMVVAMEAARGTQGNLATGAAAAGVALGDAGAAAGTAGVRVAGATGAFLSSEKATKALAQTTKELVVEQQKFLELSDAASVKGWVNELARVEKIADLDRQALFDMNLELDRQADAVRALTLARADAAANLYLQDELALYRLQTEAAKEQQKILSAINNENALRQMAMDAGVSIDQLTPKVSGAAREMSAAFRQVSGVVQTMQTAINGTFAQMLLGAKGFHDGFLDIWNSLKAGVMNILNSILSSFINSFLKGILGALTGQHGAFASAFAGLLGGGGPGGGLLGGLLGSGGAAATGAAGAGAAGVGAAGSAAGTAGTVGAGIGLGTTLAVTGGAAAAAILAWAVIKKGLFRGGEEALKVNPARDAYLSQFGGAGTGEGSGFLTLAQRLTAITGQAGGGSAFDALKSADSMEEFNAAIVEIQRILGSTGISTLQDTTSAATGMTDALSQTDAALVTLTDTFQALSEQAAAVNASLGAIPPSAWIPPGENASDWMSQERALQGFATGTGGQYRDFGAGTPVMLHGRERVMTEAEGTREAETSGGNVTIHIGSIELRDVGTRDPEAVATDLLARIEQKLRRNERGHRTGFRVALGVA